MKSRRLISVIIIAVLLPFTILLDAAAEGQERQRRQVTHLHYQLIDMGTLGGPNSGVPEVFIEVGGTPAAAQSISDQEVVIGTADTSIPDPLCFFDDCLYPNAFRWRNGALTSLGALPGAQWSSVSWISRNELVAGISENGETDPLIGLPEGHAVLWRNSGITDLGTLQGGYESFAWAVNNRGQVVGDATNGTADPYSYYYFQILGISTGTQTRAFVWDEHDGMQDLGTLGGPDAWAGLVNEQGQVAGISLTSFTPNSNNGPSCAPNVPSQDPFLWEKDAGMIDIGTFGGTCGAPQAINGRGQVVGGSYLAGNLAFHPFLWDKLGKPSLTDLGTFGGDNGLATWINDSGQIIGSADFPGDQIHHAVLWGGGTMTDLGTVGTDPCSRGLAINSGGQIVGGSSDCQTFLHAYIWENGGPMIDLNTLVPPGSDLTLTEAIYINDRGEIAGDGVLSNGDTHAFLLIPCDEQHPGLEGCDYRLVKGNTAATPVTPAPTQKSSARRQIAPAFGPTVKPMPSRIGHGLGPWYRGLPGQTPNSTLTRPLPTSSAQTEQPFGNLTNDEPPWFHPPHHGYCEVILGANGQWELDGQCFAQGFPTCAVGSSQNCPWGEKVPGFTFQPCGGFFQDRVNLQHACSF